MFKVADTALAPTAIGVIVRAVLLPTGLMMLNTAPADTEIKKLVKLELYLYKCLS